MKKYRKDELNECIAHFGSLICMSTLQQEQNVSAVFPRDMHARDRPTNCRASRALKLN